MINRRQAAGRIVFLLRLDRTPELWRLRRGAVRTAAVNPTPGQLFEPLLRLRELPRVLRVKVMPGVAGVVHYDLRCHCWNSVEIIQPPQSHLTI